MFISSTLQNEPLGSYTEYSLPDQCSNRPRMLIRKTYHNNVIRNHLYQYPELLRYTSTSNCFRKEEQQRSLHLLYFLSQNNYTSRPERQFRGQVRRFSSCTITTCNFTSHSCHVTHRAHQGRSIQVHNEGRELNISRYILHR